MKNDDDFENESENNIKGAMLINLSVLSKGSHVTLLQTTSLSRNTRISVL